MKKVLVALVGSLVGPLALGSVAFGAGSGPNEWFTIVFNGGDSAPGRLVASGVFAGAGVEREATPFTFDPSTMTFAFHDVVTFSGGTFNVSGSGKGMAHKFDPKACVGSDTSKGTFTLSGGTGRFAGLSGKGTFTSAATIHGCDEMTASRTEVVHAMGTVAMSHGH